MKNMIIKNVLSEEQIREIYKIINGVPEEDTHTQERLGHKAYLVSLGEDIRAQLEKVVQENYGPEWFLNDYQFARYSKKFGYKPKLYPHFDDAFSVHKLTLDVQVYSTVSWPLVVEGEEFVLNNNEALTFSGTDQIHWRTPMDLSDDDVVDMLFAHCEMRNDPRGPITKEHKDEMNRREAEWAQKVTISREIEEVDGE
jgi:hypothetical protein